MLQFACSTLNFPLTLTLSLREREQQASDWCLVDGRWATSGAGVIARRWTILPLPRGEARGALALNQANCGRIGARTLVRFTRFWPGPKAAD